MASPLCPPLPADFTHLTLMALGNGVNATWDTWGNALTELQGNRLLESRVHADAAHHQRSTQDVLLLICQDAPRITALCLGVVERRDQCVASRQVG